MKKKILEQLDVQELSIEKMQMWSGGSEKKSKSLALATLGYLATFTGSLFTITGLLPVGLAFITAGVTMTGIGLSDKK